MKIIQAFALAATFALAGSAAHAQAVYESAPTQSTAAPSNGQQRIYTGRSVAVHPVAQNSADGSTCGLDLASICVQ